MQQAISPLGHVDKALSDVSSESLKKLLAFFMVGVLGIIAPIPTTHLSAEIEGKTMELKSSAFQSGATIPRRHTCDADDASPQLSWSSVPTGTKTLSLIVDDPDAPGGTWVHWVIYDLPADAKELAEAVGKTETLANGGKQGLNDFRRVGYGGPCPPAGKPHRYFFKLYALNASTNLKPRATKQQLFAAMQGHVLGEAELIGRYQR
jgi:Raf kinase inhibitor-like YbhB/YbcL family protein